MKILRINFTKKFKHIILRFNIIIVSFPWGALKSVLSNRRLGIKAKKFPY